MNKQFQKERIFYLKAMNSFNLDEEEGLVDINGGMSNMRN